jgi:hypothetical protein
VQKGPAASSFRLPGAYTGFGAGLTLAAASCRACSRYSSKIPELVIGWTSRSVNAQTPPPQARVGERAVM